MKEPAPLIYEVNLTIKAEIADEYWIWLKDHLQSMLAFPGFLSAEVFETDQSVAEESLCLCIHYRVRDQACLNDYLNNQAQAMRQEGLRRFAQQFKASRRILSAKAISF